MSRQTLLDAVQALYYHPNDAVKKQAGAWLEQWQRSLDAWSTADAVLHDASSSVEAQYFCATTLRTKARPCSRLPDHLGAMALCSACSSSLTGAARQAQGERSAGTNRLLCTVSCPCLTGQLLLEQLTQQQSSRVPQVCITAPRTHSPFSRADSSRRPRSFLRDCLATRRRERPPPEPGQRARAGAAGLR